MKDLTVGSFCFAALPLELQLLIVEQLQYRSLRRLQRVSKSMRDLVAHPALDRAMFRAAYDKKALLSAPSLELHPILQRLPTYNFNISQSMKEFLPDVSEQVLQENATSPPCALIYFDSFIEHDCAGPVLTRRAEEAGYDMPDWDSCIVEHEVNGDGKAITVKDFIQGFLDSCQFSCDDYDGMQESFEDSCELVVFRGWNFVRIDREMRSGRYEMPNFEALPHEDCGLDECRQCRMLAWQARSERNTERMSIYEK